MPSPNGSSSTRRRHRHVMAQAAHKGANGQVKRIDVNVKVLEIATKNIQAALKSAEAEVERLKKALDNVHELEEEYFTKYLSARLLKMEARTKMSAAEKMAAV